MDVVVGDLLFVAETLAGGREVLHLVFAISSYVGAPRLNPSQTKALEVAWLDAKELLTAPMYPALGPVLSRYMTSEARPDTYFGRISQEWI